MDIERRLIQRVGQATRRETDALSSVSGTGSRGNGSSENGYQAFETSEGEVEGIYATLPRKRTPGLAAIRSSFLVLM